MVTASPVWGCIGILLVMLMVLSSVPIAAAMGCVGLLLAWLFYGGKLGVTLAGITSWAYAASYMLTMVPLFILMGEIIGRCGLGADAFDCFYKWLSKLKGGLAIVTTVTCALFGCITGSTAATIATIGGISLPEMKRRGYSLELRLGSIATSGCLAALIPPSIIAIIYCILVEQSVAKVFIAGIIPGIILTILYSLTIYAWVWLRPSVAPISTESFSFKEKVVSLKAPVPILVLFIAMVGGIYVGVFSPTEAAGIGVVYATALTLIVMRLTWQRFKSAMGETLRITAFIVMLIMGGLLFARSIAISRLPQYVGEIMMGLEVSPLVLIFIIIALFIGIGCILDVMGMMVLFVPLFYPTVIGLGFDPIWYGTLTVVLVELALVTPPIAAHIYITQAIDPEATAMSVTRGVIPFYACTIILLVLLVFFPQIALWLPGMM